MAIAYKVIGSSKTTPDQNTTRKEVFAKIKREIYLTFDDGIQAGTEEVLGFLNPCSGTRKM